MGQVRRSRPWHPESVRSSPYPELREPISQRVRAPRASLTLQTHQMTIPGGYRGQELTQPTEGVVSAKYTGTPPAGVTCQGGESIPDGAGHPGGAGSRFPRGPRLRVDAERELHQTGLVAVLRRTIRRGRRGIPQGDSVRPLERPTESGRGCLQPGGPNSDLAVELAAHAVALAPQRGDCWGRFGMTHYRAGDWKSAVAALEKALEFTRNEPSTRRQGRPTMARSCWWVAVPTETGKQPDTTPTAPWTVPSAAAAWSARRPAQGRTAGRCAGRWQSCGRRRRFHPGALQPRR